MANKSEQKLKEFHFPSIQAFKSFISLPNSKGVEIVISTEASFTSSSANMSGYQMCGIIQVYSPRKLYIMAYNGYKNNLKTHTQTRKDHHPPYLFFRVHFENFPGVQVANSSSLCFTNRLVPKKLNITTSVERSN